MYITNNNIEQYRIIMEYDIANPEITEKKKKVLPEPEKPSPAQGLL